MQQWIKQLHTGLARLTLFHNFQQFVFSVSLLDGWLVGWLVVFNVPSTARSFRDGTPIYCPLRRT